MESQNTTEKQTPPPKRGLPILWVIFAIAAILALIGVWYYVRTTPARPIVALGEEIYEEPAGLVRHGSPDFDGYWQVFRITNVKAKLSINFAGDRMVYVYGLFENRGELPVDAAEVKITFFDPQGKIIKERICAPLRPDTGLKKPISSLQSRDFNVRFENWPENVQVGQLEVLLTGIHVLPHK
jgi:hypothetical protein